MDTESLSRWLSIGANFGVLVGIAFLAIEIQQNTEMTRAQITQSRADAAISVADMAVNSDYIPAIYVKIQNGESLSEEDAFRYTVWLRATLRNQDNNIQQYDQGLLGEHIPRSAAGVVRGVIKNNPVGRDYWARGKTSYSDAYIAFVEAILAEDE
jgi:hypothetical protein